MAVLLRADGDALGRAIGNEISKGGKPQPWAFDLWVSDSDEGNRLSQTATTLEKRARFVVEHLAKPWAAQQLASAREAFAKEGIYVQACLFSPDRIALGLLPAHRAPSLAPGGRLRVHIDDDAPSRAAAKLAEAFLWLGRAPEPQDVCVDLGAAPGGWSYVLLQHRAKVYAVDRGKLAPNLRNQKNLEHIPADAFHFNPGDPVDWLCCDMAWRPLEVAGLLARWARRGWARHLIVNFKLPMKKKAEHLFRIRDILSDGGWSSLRARQLYHDRDEVTIAGVRI